MSFFGLAKTFVGGDQAKLIQQAADLVSAQGGLDGLIAKFKAGGMGEMVQSWIGTGENLPLAKEQLVKALGSDVVKSMAEKAGMDPEKTSAQLATLLPQVIDRLTPNGKLPEGGIKAEHLLAIGTDLLKSKIQ